jgi:uncharacterized protein
MTGNNPDLQQSKRSSLFTRRNFLLGTSAAAAGLALYSSEFARHQVSILTRNIGIARLPERFHDFRIVQISDLHFEEFTEPFFLRRVVEHVNRLAPDMVVITGDFVSYGPLPNTFAETAVYRCADILRDLTCPLRYAVLGNHDVTVSASIVTHAVQGVGIKMLRNESVRVERGADHLWLAGVLDPASDRPNLHAAIPEKPDAPVVLLCHCPDYADAVNDHPRGHFVDLMLSGHTHGGQVRLPIIGPTILPAWGLKYVEGLYRIDRMQLYVNRGLGTVGLPFRLNCPPEITEFSLRPA